MKKIIIAVLLLLAGCKYTQTAYGPELREEVTVESTTYVPSTTHTGGGTGFTTGGDLTFSSTSLTSPEDWIVVFRCKHGKFIVHDKVAWQKAIKDSTYTCVYREVYRQLVDDGDGKTNVLSRTLVDFDFIRIEARQ